MFIILLGFSLLFNLAPYLFLYIINLLRQFHSAIIHHANSN